MQLHPLPHAENNQQREELSRGAWLGKSGWGRGPWGNWQVTGQETRAFLLAGAFTA